jgi:hypothetical protein
MQLKNSLLIELLAGNTSRVDFGDQAILRGRQVLTILPTPNTTPAGSKVYGLAGQELVNLLAGATLTLKTAANKDIHTHLPLRYLYESAEAGHPLELGQEVIDWTKSYITIPPNSGGAGTVVQVTVIFQ